MQFTHCCWISQFGKISPKKKSCLRNFNLTNNKQINIIDRYTSFPLCVKWGSKLFMIITQI